MIFIHVYRFALLAYVLIVDLNVDMLIGLNATPLEKGLLTIAGLALIASRGVNVGALAALALITVVAIGSAALTDYTGFHIDRFVRGLFSLVAPWLLLTARPRAADAKVILLAFAWLPLGNVITGILYQGMGLTTVFETHTPRMQGASIASGLASMCLVGALSAMLYAHQFRKPRYYLVLLLNLLLLLLTAARGPFLIAMLVLPVTYVAYCRPRLQEMLAVLIALPFAGVVMFIVAGQSLVERLGNSSLSGREMLWEELYSVLAKYWEFGIGLGHQIDVVSERVKNYTATVAAHNEYLRIAVECGYYGGVAILVLFIALFVSVWGSPRIRFAPPFLAGVIGFAVYAANDNALSSAIIPFLVIVISFAYPVAAPRAAPAPRPVRRAIAAEQPA